jgi:transcriptional regulator with XRE-family HTH domain
LVHSLAVASTSYADVIVRNLRAVRVRKKLEQRDLVERMRQLGFPNWHRQTLSRIEQGQRNLLAAELLGLAYALETSIDVLLAPAADERGYIELGDGAVHMRHAAARVRGVSDGAIRWDGNTPDFMVDHAGMSSEPAAEDYFADPAPGQETG